MDKKHLFFTRIALLVFVFSVGTCISAQAAWLWSPEIGKWINPKKASKDTPEDQFSWAMEFFKGKDYDRAIDEFEKMPVAFPNSKLSAEAVYYTGLSYLEKNDLGKAADNFQKVIDRYPYSDRIKDASEREFEIAGKFADGEKIKLAGVPVFSGYDKAIELYKHIVTNAPYGGFGDKAQYEVGRVYEKIGEYDEAIKAYEQLIDEYPDSDLAVQAKYQIAQATSLSASKIRFNDETAQSAIDEFEKFKEEHPEAAEISAADESIKILRMRKAQRSYDIAEFYEKRGKQASAKIYYTEAAEKYSDTPAGQKAQEKLGQIKSPAQETVDSSTKPASSASSEPKKKSFLPKLPKVKLWPF